MLSKPDFVEKRILYIGNSSNLPNQLKFQGCNLRLYRNGKPLNQISCYLVNCIFVLGEHTFTTQLLRQLNKFGIGVFFLSQSFHPYTCFIPTGAGNYLLRKKQYSFTKTEELDIAKKIVINKINNQMSLLTKTKRFVALYEEDQVSQCFEEKVLLGLEGNASRKYFSAIFAPIKWKRRTPRTKEDIPNLLLDMGYTFLFNYVDALLQLFGFDTYKGVYHQLFFQRKSLSCDVMEPMRMIIDHALIKAYGLQRVKETDFKFENQMFVFKDNQVAQRYVAIFTQAIMEENDKIYDFVLNFYRHLMDCQKYPWKDFVLC